MPAASRPQLPTVNGSLTLPNSWAAEGWPPCGGSGRSDLAACGGLVDERDDDGSTDEAKADVFDSTKRSHSNIKYLSPMEFGMNAGSAWAAVNRTGSRLMQPQLVRLVPGTSRSGALILIQPPHKRRFASSARSGEFVVRDFPIPKPSLFRTL